MKQLSLNFGDGSMPLASLESSSFIPSQHYPIEDNPNIYYKILIHKPISNTWCRAYYAYTMRHLNDPNFPLLINL